MEARLFAMAHTYQALFASADKGNFDGNEAGRSPMLLQSHGLTFGTRKSDFVAS